MILQRNTEVPIWGTGEEGAVITVEYGGLQAEAVVEAGKWKALLSPMNSVEPCEIIIRSDECELLLSDVLFGDVWLAGGQSNMEYKLAHSAEGAEEIPAAQYSLIRYYEVPKREWENGTEQKGEWKVCTPADAPMFSAVAYHFAKDVHKEINVPIGIIGCNWGGTSASCWLKEEALTEDEELRVYIDEFQEQLKDFTWDQFNIERKRFDDLIAENARLEAQGVSHEELNYPWPPPMSPHSFLRPNGLYHTMLEKTAPYALKGFLYYQGESDGNKPLLYNKLLTKLICNWRELWSNEKLPFLFVQLPAFGCDGNPEGEDWALLRESQQLVSNHVSGAAMAVALDCGEEDDIHPRHKRQIGQRLARIALEHVYERPIASSGPTFNGVTFEENIAVVSFDFLELDDRSEGEAQEITGFDLAAADGPYVKAEARVRNGKVEVWSDQVINPCKIRYGWANFTTANLHNRFGLPAAPFRSDCVRG